MAQASSDRASKIVRGPYEGMYGNWNLTQGDVDGVNLYRGALLVSALCTGAGVASYQLDLANGLLLDALFGVHTIAFGVALAYIHIYIKPLHNMLKILYGAGLVGAAAICAAIPDGGGLVNAVLGKPALMLAVGWQFVALTGNFFKEAICFGRVEALALTLLLPVIAGGHFLGVVDGVPAQVGSAVFAATYIAFALRKFTQLPEADIGDNSVFQHYAKMGK